MRTIRSFTLCHSIPELPVKPLLISHFTATSAIGLGCAASWHTLCQQKSGLTPCAFADVALDTYIGVVSGLEHPSLPAELSEFDCRNNRLSQLALEQDQFSQAIERVSQRYGAARIGVFIGTSTSGILQTELAYRQRDPLSGALPEAFNYRGTHSTFSVAQFVQSRLKLLGPALAVSTACSSSAKVFSSARRMLEAGWIDAALVGGVDSLCLTTLYGFNSLELLSPQPCRPYDRARDGISIGEAAAFLLLERVPPSLDANAILLSGCGESSDAYHMSTPHPQGRGAIQALESASLAPEDIDYINLHGTATPSNDNAEGAAVAHLFGANTPASSTKGATGHTLGAAGGLEAVISALALTHGIMPAGINTQTRDPAIDIHYLLEPRPQALRHVLSNSFGFGGSNCSLIFSRAN